MAKSRVLSMVVISTVGALAGGMSAQTPLSPAFEVASVKSNKSGAPNVGAAGDRFANGQFQTTNIPLRLLMRQAFERWQNVDLVGGPAWIDTDRWDIKAKADSPAVDMRPMIRSLLGERFKLVTHHEMRALPIYAVTIARRDGRLGPSLRSSTEPFSLVQDRFGVYTVRGQTIEGLAARLNQAVRRPVVDRTGLRGTYDIDLHFAPLDPVPGAELSPPVDAPSIFTAVQEQLGLTLEATTGPVDVLEIDHVERPTED
jgi:uncharacterized protein (TIGR03435 family)